MKPQDIVIIGSGIAGITTAREVRKLDPSSTITLITADDGAQYSKPMLSNAFALSKTPESLVQKQAEDWAADLTVTVHPHTRVVNIDRAAQSVNVSGPQGDRTIGYARLVLATGASARPYSVEGSDLAPLHTVNDLDDYTHWREALQADTRVLIVGAGLIGSEFANDLTLAGHAVSIVDPAPWPLGRLLPQALGEAMADALSDIGIALHLGRTISRMAPDQNGGWTAQLDDGSSVGFDLALSAIGLVPNTGLAVAAGLQVENGISVDRFMATSDPAIYAIGDCAQGEAGVLPYILPVMTQARALAKTLTGEETPALLPAMPVNVKTPALPCVVCPPPMGANGQWVVSGQGADLRGLFVGNEGQPLGFALTGSETKARQAMAKDMPDLVAELRAA